ncbi:MAG: hypothetical protein GY772_22695 [bacterium]|nr:hypothetical protein [bacterium]
MRKALGDEIAPAFGPLLGDLAQRGPEGPTHVLVQDLKTEEGEGAEAPTPLAPRSADTEERRIGCGLDVPFFKRSLTTRGETTELVKGPKAPMGHHEVARPLGRGTPFRPGLPGLWGMMPNHKALAANGRADRLPGAAEGVLGPSTPECPGLLNVATVDGSEEPSHVDGGQGPIRSVDFLGWGLTAPGFDNRPASGELGDPKVVADHVMRAGRRRGVDKFG